MSRKTNFHWQLLSVSNGLIAQGYYSPKVKASNQSLDILEPLCVKKAIHQ